MLTRDLTGDVYGRLTVLEPCPKKPGKGRQWRCACSCGGTKIVIQSSLVCNNTTSCGCKKIENAKNMKFRHGKRGTSEYWAWVSMKKRCSATSGKYWKYYGSKGVHVCPEWLDDYEAFLAYVGPRPTSKHSLDRIDGNGNYEPGNVRWATPTVQHRNQSNRHWLSYMGVTLLPKQWSEIVGFRVHTLYTRIREKWSTEAILTTPVQPPHSTYATSAEIIEAISRYATESGSVTSA